MKRKEYKKFKKFQRRLLKGTLMVTGVLILGNCTSSLIQDENYLIAGFIILGMGLIAASLNLKEVNYE